MGFWDVVAAQPAMFAILLLFTTVIVGMVLVSRKQESTRRDVAFAESEARIAEAKARATEADAAARKAEARVAEIQADLAARTAGLAKATRTQV